MKLELLRQFFKIKTRGRFTLDKLINVLFGRDEKIFLDVIADVLIEHLPLFLTSPYIKKVILLDVPVIYVSENPITIAFYLNRKNGGVFAIIDKNIAEKLVALLPGDIARELQPAITSLYFGTTQVFFDKRRTEEEVATVLLAQMLDHFSVSIEKLVPYVIDRASRSKLYELYELVSSTANKLRRGELTIKIDSENEASSFVLAVKYAVDIVNIAVERYKQLGDRVNKLSTTLSSI